jgi:hypothetical protein
MRAQAGVPSAPRTDTPTLVALADVTGERNIASQHASGASVLRAQGRVLDKSANPQPPVVGHDYCQPRFFLGC